MPRNGYENLEAKAAKGEYELIDPLDYKLMGLLPPEGELMFDLYPVGTSSREIVAKLPGLRMSIVQRRVSILGTQGLIKKVKMPGNERGATGWQITTAGAKVLKEWEGSHGS